MMGLRRLALAGAILLLLCGALLALVGTAASLADGPALLTVTFLDVGQGDAIWVQLPDGQDVLIDGGPVHAGPFVVAYLESHGCDGIEYMVLSHPHADHVGGLIAVLDEIPTSNLWYTGENYPTATYTRFRELAEERALPMIVQRAGKHEQIGAAQLAMLHPFTLGGDANANSLVCRLSYEDTAFLFTGDITSQAEEEILSRGYELAADVLKVAHHGAKESSRREFLQAVAPEVAVISVGATNPYGHPSPAVIDRLLALPAAVYRTDLHDTVTVTSDGTSVSVRFARRYLFLPFVVR